MVVVEEIHGEREGGGGGAANDDDDDDHDHDDVFVYSPFMSGVGSQTADSRRRIRIRGIGSMSIFRTSQRGRSGEVNNPPRTTGIVDVVGHSDSDARTGADKPPPPSSSSSSSSSSSTSLRT